MILRAYLFLMITALSWGGNAVAGKLAVGHISPMLLTSLRWAMALMILLAFTLPQVRRDIKVIRANLPLLMAYGAVGFTAFNILLYSALQYTTAINVAIEQAGMPMLIFLANFILFRIKVTPAQILGFMLTLAGVAITASGGSLARLIGLELNRGDALMLLAVLCYGGYTVALRYKPQLHWQSMITVMAASAFLTSLPFAAFEITREIGDLARHHRLARRGLYRHLPLAGGPGAVHQGQRNHRLQPRRHLHQPGAHLRHAAERDDFGRDATPLSRCGAGAGAWGDLVVGAGEGVGVAAPTLTHGSAMTC